MTCIYTDLSGDEVAELCVVARHLENGAISLDIFGEIGNN
jgi:hypothetical protein